MYHNLLIENARAIHKGQRMLLHRRLSPLDRSISKLAIGQLIALFAMFLLGSVPTFAQIAGQLDSEATQAYESGRFEEAARLAKQLYDLQQKQLGPDAPEVATAALN